MTARFEPYRSKTLIIATKRAEGKGERECVCVCVCECKHTSECEEKQAAFMANKEQRTQEQEQHEEQHEEEEEAGRATKEGWHTRVHATNSIIFRAVAGELSCTSGSTCKWRATSVWMSPRA